MPEQASPEASQEVPVCAKGELHSGAQRNSTICNRCEESRTNSLSLSSLPWQEKKSLSLSGAKRVKPIVFIYLYQVPRESCQSVPKESCRSVPVQKPTKVLFWKFCTFISLPDEGGKASLLRGWFSQVWRWLRWLPWLRKRVRLFVLSLKDLNKDYKQNSSIMLALKSSVKMP